MPSTFLIKDKAKKVEIVHQTSRGFVRMVVERHDFTGNLFDIDGVKVGALEVSVLSKERALNGEYFGPAIKTDPRTYRPPVAYRRVSRFMSPGDWVASLVVSFTVGSKKMCANCVSRRQAMNRLGWIGCLGWPFKHPYLWLKFLFFLGVSLVWLPLKLITLPPRKLYRWTVLKSGFSSQTTPPATT